MFYSKPRALGGTDFALAAVLADLDVSGAEH